MKFKKHLFEGHFLAAFLLGSILTSSQSCKEKRPAPAPFDNSSGLTEEIIDDPTATACTPESPCTYQITGIFLNLGGLCSNVVHNAPMPLIAAREQLETVINSDRNTSDLSCYSCPNNLEVQDGLTSSFKIVGFTYTETKQIDATQESKSLGEPSDTNPKTCESQVPDPNPVPPVTDAVPAACLEATEPGADLGIDSVTGIFAEIDVAHGGTDDICNRDTPLGYYQGPYGGKLDGATIYYSCVIHPELQKARWKCGLSGEGTPYGN